MQEKVSQADVIANLAAQAEGQGVDLSHSDLSTIAWEGLDASGATIAMSLFRGARFAAPQALNGCTWIGNRLENCRFESVDLAKAELLDCEFESCFLEDGAPDAAVTVEADRHPDARAFDKVLAAILASRGRS